jgi:hypothetical protein
MADFLFSSPRLKEIEGPWTRRLDVKIKSGEAM